MTDDPRGDLDYRRPLEGEMGGGTLGKTYGARDAIEDRQNVAETPEMPEMPELELETVLETGDWSSDPASVGVVLLTFMAVGAVVGVLIAAV